MSDDWDVISDYGDAAVAVVCLIVWAIIMAGVL